MGSAVPRGHLPSFAPGRRSLRSIRMDRRGATEQVDGVLMIGTTLVAAAALVALLSSAQGPAERVHADLALSIDEGVGGWGTGDERVILRHKGGAGLDQEDVRFVVTVGSARHVYEGADLGFVGGLFTVGSEWTRTHAIPHGARVGVEVVARTGNEAGTGTGPGIAVTGGTYLEEAIFLGSVTAYSGPPDLLITHAWTDPPVPYTGGPDMRLFVRITNVGGGPVGEDVPIEAQFRIGATDLGTASHTGGLLPGSSVVLTSGIWPILPYSPANPWSQVGIYTATITADPSDRVTEADETNNVRNHIFQVAPGIYDPGYPYEDPNHDTMYTPGYDHGLSKGEVQDGHHITTNGKSLVIPPSTGDINGAQLYMTHNGGSVVIGVNLTSSGNIHIRATEGSIFMEGIRVTAGGSITIEMVQSSAQDGVSVRGSTLTAGTRIDVVSKSGWVDLVDAKVHAQGGPFQVLADDGVLEARRGDYRSSGAILFEAQGNIDVGSAKFQAGTQITLDAKAATRSVTVTLAEFRDADNKALLRPNGVTVVGTPAFGTWSY